MNAIAADLARTRKAFEQAHIPRQSTTVPDLAAAEKAKEESGHGHGVMGALGSQSLLAKIAEGAVAGWELGEERGVITGALGAVGSHVIGAMRGAGLKKADDLVKEALLNRTGDGELAKALLMHAPIKPNVGSEVTGASTAEDRGAWGGERRPSTLTILMFARGAGNKFLLTFSSRIKEGPAAFCRRRSPAWYASGAPAQSSIPT